MTAEQPHQPAEPETKGDSKRRQAKMTDLAEKAQHEKQQFCSNVRDAQWQGQERRKSMQLKTTTKKKQKPKHIQYLTTKEEADQTLKNVSKEDQLVKEVIRQMCLGCERIYQVAPVDLTFPPRRADHVHRRCGLASSPCRKG